MKTLSKNYIIDEGSNARSNKNKKMTLEVEEKKEGLKN